MKRKEEYKINRVRYKYTNYFSLFNYCESNKENTSNEDKDLIIILKEIEWKEDTAVLVKVEKKKIRIIKSQKKAMCKNRHNEEVSKII